jgi:hypothetical protein
MTSSSTIDDPPTAERATRRPLTILRWIVICVAVAAPAVTDLVGYRIVRDKPEPVIAGVERFEVPSRYHTNEHVIYSTIPPVGGPHAPIWLNCGTYFEPVKDENAVHSLEHGAVWITYGPDLPEDQVQILRNLVHGKDHVILSPYNGLPAPVVASAWGRQLRLADPTDPRLARFVDVYRSGTQTAEKGAPCDHGVGKPSS